MSTIQTTAFAGETGAALGSIDNIAFGENAVPEPGTVGLLGIGLLVAWGLRRR